MSPRYNYININCLSLCHFMPLMLIYQFADGDVEYDTANGLAGANTLIGYWAVS